MSSAWRQAAAWAAHMPELAGRRPVAVRAFRDGLSIVGAGVLVLLLVASPGTDSHAYWAFDVSAPYQASTAALGQHDAFFYAPPVALALVPLHLLPWPVFRVAWLCLEFAALVAVSRSWALALVAVYPVALELSAGNVDLLLAAVVVLGFRYPAAWSFALLTKVTPGIGLLWFAVRREWRALGLTALATAALVGASLMVVPAWWPQWLAALGSNVGTVPPASAPHLPVSLPLRILAAGALTTWGARGNRRWMLPVAVTLALPELWIAGLSVLAGCVLLAGPARRVARGANQSEGVI